MSLLHLSVLLRSQLADCSRQLQHARYRTQLLFRSQRRAPAQGQCPRGLWPEAPKVHWSPAPTYPYCSGSPAPCLSRSWLNSVHVLPHRILVRRALETTHRVVFHLLLAEFLQSIPERPKLLTDQGLNLGYPMVVSLPTNHPLFQLCELPGHLLEGSRKGSLHLHHTFNQHVDSSLPYYHELLPQELPTFRPFRARASLEVGSHLLQPGLYPCNGRGELLQPLYYPP
ncbi:Hypothetical protein NTJ_00240 [Nesidiocoris tenuis]|uniref:Uncharacterized protein n=1 Tax=Nesidiocoris tenuis TaxID=355587 RepID=A0ABN7A8H7_9HEMI|nr:Hypothetical protein NTJ_00240 [Nesidiocoris tenuis]